MNDDIVLQTNSSDNVKSWNIIQTTNIQLICNCNRQFIPGHTRLLSKSRRTNRAMSTYMFYLHVGSGKWANQHTTTLIGLSISSIEKYVVSNIAPQSLFKDLLIEKRHWELQWLMDGKGDKSVTKCGKHSIKYAPFIRTDCALGDVAKRVQQSAIHVQIVFNEAEFQKWEQQQQRQELIPVPTILKIKENSKHLKIKVNCPQEPMYNIYYKVYETNNNDHNSIDWQELEDGCNQVFLSNLWKFKKYTFETVLKNKYSGIFGESHCKNGIEITLPKILFDCGSKDEISLLTSKQEFELFDHDRLYKWCKIELKTNEVFDDVRSMQYGKITIEWILTMIKGFEPLTGRPFLWKDVSSSYIIGNLLKAEIGKNFQLEHENEENNDAFSIRLCLSILSRLRVIAFKTETKLGYVPNNEYVIYFWCFFHEKPTTDVYIRCCEPSLS